MADQTSTNTNQPASTNANGTANASDAPGWYGKLSILGDFAHRRLPAEFIRVGDAWLSHAMTASHQQLGDRWLDVYLNAPVMRFAWAPGVADAQHWWFGLLMPSCDNVGRYFPLLIAHRRTRPPLDRIALDHLESWFDHLAEAAAHTLGDQASIESFEQALSDAPPWPTPSARTWLPPRPMSDSSASASASPTPSSTSVSTTERYLLGRNATLNHWLYAMAIDDLHMRFSGCSIWWRRNAAGQESIASVVRGLPEASAFAQMLSGT